MSNEYSEIKYIGDLKRKCLTPFGYQTIEYVFKTPPLETLKITHEFGSIIVSKNHHFIDPDDKEIAAIDLKIGDLLETINGESKILDIEDAGVRELYDITLDTEEFGNQWYYSDGVLSHNSGKSITVACYLAWLFNFNHRKNIGIVANRGAQAREFLRNTKDIFTRLPMFLTVGITEWSKSTIANESEMRILTDVPSEDSFRGYTVDCLVVDECIHRNEIITVRDKLTGEVFETTIGDFFNKMNTHGSQNEKTLFFNNRQVLTSNGFQDFIGIRKTIKNTGIRITTKNGDIQVTENHKFFDNGVFIPVTDLKVGDKLNNQKIIKIENINEKSDYYDLLNVSNGNHYTTSGFESSNCAFIEASKWEEFADSVFPSQTALSWKKNIIISTAKGLNHFYEIVQRAKNQSLIPGSGTTLVEVDWMEVPRYDAKGLISPEEFRKKIISRYGRAYFEQNYGNNFMGSAETLIDSEVLEKMVPKAAEEDFEGLTIYQTPEPGHTYLMGVDPAKGGGDYFAVQVLDITSFPFVQAAAAKISTSYLEMPARLYDWGIYYNSAFMIIENNEGSGQSIADALSDHWDYPNMHYDTGKVFPGFRTTTKSRESILRMLQVLGNNGKIIIQDTNTLDELSKFEKKNGKYEASKGHDDMVMSLALSISPLTNYQNFEDYGKFLDSLKSGEEVDTSEFFVDLSSSFVDM